MAKNNLNLKKRNSVLIYVRNVWIPVYEKYVSLLDSDPVLKKFSSYHKTIKKGELVSKHTVQLWYEYIKKRDRSFNIEVEEKDKKNIIMSSLPVQSQQSPPTQQTQQAQSSQSNSGETNATISNQNNN